MIWNEVLRTLLQTVIVVAVPILAASLCKFLTVKREELKATTDNAIASALIGEAYDAISTAVTYVSQTYVDTLKKSGQFSKENQAEAFNMAKEAALQTISDNAKNYIENTLGGLDAWLTTNIEAQVREAKENKI